MASQEDLKAELMGMAPKKRVYPKKNRIFVDNRLRANGAANDDFGKIVAEYSVPADNEDGFENVSEALDLKKVEFLLMGVREALVGGWNQEESRFDYTSPEREKFHNCRVFNHEGVLVYEGKYSDNKKQINDEWNLSYKQAAYVFLVRDGKVDTERMFRWEISGSSFETWFPVVDLVEEAEQAGVLKTFGVLKTEEAQNGSVTYNKIFFKEGSVEVPLEAGVPLKRGWKNALAALPDTGGKVEALPEPDEVTPQAKEEDKKKD